MGALVAFLAFASFSSPLGAQVLREEFWVPDSPVSDIAVANGAVYLAGEFMQVGPATGAFVGLDAATGATLQPFPEVDGVVLAVADDGAGGWYIGGSFTSVQGQPRNHLARLDASGQVTGWNPDANDAVSCLVRDSASGIVYAGGDFYIVGGAQRLRIAAIDANGQVTAWNAGFSEASSKMNALSLANGVLYCGGSFQLVAGQSRSNGAAFDAATGALLPWDPQVNVGTGWYIGALAPYVVVGFPTTVTVYIGGVFTTVGGQPRENLAAVDGTTGALLGWNPGADGGVGALATAGGSNPITNPLRIYVGGSFSQVAGTPRSRLAQLNDAGGVASWKPGPDGPVAALRVAGGLLYVGGAFSSIGGQSIRYLAAVDRTTGAATAWDALVGGPVSTIATTASAVFAGGDFWTVGGERRSRLAALDLATGLPTPWDPDADGLVSTLAVGNGVVYAGGSFTSIGGQPRGYLAALDPTSGVPTAWAPNADQTVDRLAVGNGVLYAGGSFTTIGGQPRTRLAALDPASALATAWNPSPNAAILAITPSGGSVFVSGQFTVIGGQVRFAVAELDAASGLATGWTTAAFPLPVVRAVQPHGDVVWVGGQFQEIGGRPRSHLATLDAVTGAAGLWDPYVEGSGVNDLAVEGGAIYVAGNFFRLLAVERRGIAALDLATGEVLPWNPPVVCRPTAIAVQDGVVYASGDFVHVHRTFAVFSNPMPTAVGAGPRPDFAGLRAGPNPFRSDVALGFTLPRSGQVEIAIYDVRGRRVRRLSSSAQEAGEHRVAWDGRDDAGRSVSAGIYFARIEALSVRATAKLLRLE